MMPVFAMLNLNMRMVFAWVTLCVVCMLGLSAWRLPDMVFEYVSICVASVLAAVGAARLVRGAVLNALSARLEAIHEREEAVRISEHDPLTGLPNRRSFFVAFNERREALHEKGRKFLLILVDLDGFKPVNDVYGHPAGDELLRAVAGRLKAASLPYSLEAGVVRVSGSAGVYVCERTDLRRGAMFERADHALYRAKQERRGEAVVFSDEHEADFLGENHVDRTLSKADLESELTLEFQPQYDLVENRIAGFEALARWRSPQLGPVSPDVFIAAAERTTQMSRVTQVLLGKALNALEALPGHLRLAMNLSAHDLISESNVRRIVDRVRESGVDATRLEFEITETAMLDDHETAARSLATLQDCGVSIALDDFGSGYSNFSYLQQLKVPKLKIDRSFVKPLMRDGSAAKILRTLVTLSKSLNMECVVEGVENPEELKRIDAMGARYVQGFLLAAPMPAAAIPQFLAEAPDSFEQMRRPQPASCSNLSYRRLA
jgi:predicted signal transduction protein with EAL and GGDEF domain